MEPPSRPSIQVMNDSGRVIDTGVIEDAVALAFGHHQRVPEEVNVLLTADAHVRALNRQFRSLDTETDVLTFPASDDGSGDIAIAVGYAERQAALRGVTLAQELAYLAVHGALHLIGFDDETDEDRAGMMAEMNRVAILAGLPEDPSWCSLLHAEEVA